MSGTYLQAWCDNSIAKEQKKRVSTLPRKRGVVGGGGGAGGGSANEILELFPDVLKKKKTALDRLKQFVTGQS